MWNVLLQRTHSMAGCPEQCVRCISACWAITGNEKVMACGSAVDVTLNSHLIPDVEQGASSFCTFLFLLSHFFCVFFITSLKIKPGKTTCTCLRQRLALVVFSVALVKPLYVTNIDTDILWFGQELYLWGYSVCDFIILLVTITRLSSCLPSAVTKYCFFFDSSLGSLAMVKNKFCISNTTEQFYTPVGESKFANFALLYSTIQQPDLAKLLQISQEPWQNTEEKIFCVSSKRKQ